MYNLCSVVKLLVECVEKCFNTKMYVYKLPFDSIVAVVKDNPHKYAQ